MGLIESLFSGFEALRILINKKKKFRVGIYGPTNAGKTTLANRISMDFLGEEMGVVSSVPHETREVNVKEGINMEYKDKKLKIDLIDTPGFESKINYKEFMKKGFSRKKAKQRALEASAGVIQAIKYLRNVDFVLVVVDSSKSPYMQFNLALLSNLKVRSLPVLLVANKTDLKRSNMQRLKNAFPEYKVVGISAKKGYGINNLYENIAELLSKKP